MRLSEASDLQNLNSEEFDEIEAEVEARQHRRGSGSKVTKDVRMKEIEE